MKNAICSESNGCAEEEMLVFFIHNPESEMSLKTIAKSFVTSLLSKDNMKEE